ncbi:MAG TPA: HAD hydrolase family protein [Patescibacteria group bacterium]|nr:HAD hydrolase family protein [Patescibacteria group bacterium]
MTTERPNLQGQPETLTDDLTLIEIGDVPLFLSPAATDETMFAVPKIENSGELNFTPRAFLFDIDGTACLNQPGAHPSERVTGAMAQAQAAGVHMGAMTGRPLFQAREMFPTLSGPSVLHGGAIIADLSTGEIFRSHPLSADNIDTIAGMVAPLAASHYVEVISTENFVPLTRKEELNGDPLEVYVSALEEDAADALLANLAELTTVAAHKLISYTPGKIDVYITNALARKDASLFEVADMLGISASEIIGIGDGFNDLPWLQHCGLSVAMENAVWRLKYSVDCIAPSVYDDGVAKAIERFCLAK